MKPLTKNAPLESRGSVIDEPNSGNYKDYFKYRQNLKNTLKSSVKED